MLRSAPHTETLDWLQDQVIELDRWRTELTQFAEDTYALKIERLDAHREWLAGQLQALGAPIAGFGK